jgi:hypothetical protein
MTKLFTTISAPSVSWSAKADHPRLHASKGFTPSRQDAKPCNSSRAAGAHQPIEWRSAPKVGLFFLATWRLGVKRTASTRAQHIKKVVGGPPSRTMTQLGVTLLGSEAARVGGEETNQ